MDWKTKNADIRDELRVLNKPLPEIAKGFGALSKARQGRAGCWI